MLAIVLAQMYNLQKNLYRQNVFILSISPKRLEEIQNIPDSVIDTSDIPELDDNFWKNARVIKPTSQTNISLCLDSDVLEWFQSEGKSYKTLINEVLRSYINTQKNEKI